MAIDITKDYPKTAKLVDEHIDNGKSCADCIPTPCEGFQKALASFNRVQHNLGRKEAGDIAFELVKASNRVLRHTPEAFHHWPSIGKAVGVVAAKKGTAQGQEALNLIKSTKAFGKALPYQKGAFYDNVRAMCPRESVVDILAHHLCTQG